MDKTCDFCNTDTEETENYYYRSPILNRMMKVCLCDKCVDKNKRNIFCKVKRGK